MLNGIFFSLADSFRNFSCLTNTCANVSVAISDNYECCKTEVTTTLYNLCYTLD